nr:immunoglobulin heavy chain junction region [Macaca mulatta]MOX93986.1 immunoglobulin heavy chain junction region [Macaca mulatta]MOX94096.1 immunoglobulin heavy chain junction region [Macaca mulatta]MOX95255.1 immunoglobulin heavy chain junction region [Macaca mulatta]MOX96949.1 immunoglobulin heavy chain junction region [Macaca mulatta]
CVNSGVAATGPDHW